MSDKLSSPSASSGNSSGFSPRGRGSNNGNGDASYLVVRREPPKHLYSNESFELEIQLETAKNRSSLSAGAHAIELFASLHDVKTGRLCGSEGILITDPSRIILTSAGEGSKRMCRVTCMIRMDGIRRDQGAAMELRFVPRPDTSSPMVGSISSVATNAIHLVNYKIRLSMDEEWGRVWYKDEGGRDKSMEVFAAIYDKDGNVRTGEQIPLQPILCYDAGDGTPVRVTNQEILRTLGATKILIDKDMGKARIRFRVEDVSKNHQGQDFKLEVGPDPKAKNFKDVAPAFTPSVNVRSKRNKRSRNPSTGRSSSEKRSSPVAGRPRFDDQREMSFEGGDLPRLREAMKGVINWADEVVNGLYPLQWQVLGYSQNPDGSPDYARPYHNMPNPNPCISRILSLYSDSVRENLRILLNAVEANPSRPDEPTYMPMASSLPRESEDPYAMMRSPPQPPLHGHGGGIPPQAMGRGPPGLHPSVASEAFRDNSPDARMALQARGQLPPIHQPLPGHPYMRPRADEGDMIPMHGPPPPHRRTLPPHPGDAELPMQRSLRPDEESRESEVEYLLAKQYKTLRTGERLGFPAYSANKEILGFYRESQGKVGVGQFTAISRHRNEFGPLEIMQATEILEDAIVKKSEAVHALKDWGSIANVLDHALVYDWSKDIGNDPSATSATD